MKIIVFYFFLLSASLLTSCSNGKGNNEEEMVVQVRSSKHTNRGTPIYLVIKETSMADFLIDDYHQIATQSFWKEEHPHQLIKKVLVPGKTTRLTVDIANQEKSLGLYFIFTSPGDCWKYFVDHPRSKTVKVLLGENEYEAINVYDS